MQRTHCNICKKVIYHDITMGTDYIVDSVGNGISFEIDKEIWDICIKCFSIINEAGKKGAI